MVDKIFVKQVNVEDLTSELKSANFNIFGVSYDSGSNSCIVHLDPSETKDPASVVNAHIYKDPNIKATKVRLRDELGELIKKKNALIELGESIVQVNADIAAKKTEITDYDTANP